MTSVPETGRELLADLRRMGWPDPIEIWDKFASHSGARIIEENIVDAKIVSEAPNLSGIDFHVVNQLKITTELFHGSLRIFFNMSFRVSHTLLMSAPSPYSGGGYLDDVEVGQFEWWTSAFSGDKIYKDKNWYPLSDKPMSVFATLPVRTIDPTHVESFSDVPTVPAPGRGRALREEMEKSNAEREMRRKLATSRPKCAPMLDSNNRVTCACRTNAPDLFWCESSNFYVKNPATLNTLSHRVSPGGFPDHDGMDGYLPWTHGYLDLPVFYGRVTHEGDTLNGRVNVSERHSGLSIEIASGRGESLQTASDMYLSYYKATMDMLFIGDAIKDIQREIGSLDRLSAYTNVPFKQCPNRRHMVSEDRLMTIKILSALESGTLPEDIILSEAWSITFNGKCTVCMENKFVVPPEDLM